MTSTALHLAVVAVAAALAAPASAQAVYRCVDKEGRVLYTDTNAGNCKIIETAGSGAISSPPTSSRRPAASMRQGAARAPAATASPVNFPRVDSAAQRARDDDRRAILDEELRAEEKKLADLRRDAGSREDIGRAEKNVEALKREIANIR